MVWCQNRRSSRDDPRDFWIDQDMDDLQAPPSEPPGSGSEPTSDPLKSISLTSTAPWPPELRPGEGQLVRPFEARQRRSEERRVGQECVRPGRSRGSANH